MTEYTLDQMIEKFRRNPNLKFKYIGEESNKMTLGNNLHLSEYGYVVNGEGKPVLSNFSLNSKFRLVNEPVDRMEAFKAFSEGKSIYCLLRGSRYDYKPDLVSQFVELRTQADEPISVQEILYGKWFIKEE